MNKIMIIKSTITIPSLSMEERRLYVSLPDDYEQTNQSYPVLYMFDGHNVFYDEDATYGKSWGMKEYLEKSGRKLIVVGVECSHEGNARISEYTCFDYDKDSFFGEVKARGNLYMDWLVTTLKPMIDSSYRTLPDREHTSICGSSMGGLMTVYACVAYNKYFGAGAGLSPALWLHADKMHQMISDAEFYGETYLYMDAGSEENGYELRNQVLNSIADHLEARGVNVCLRVIYGGSHSEASWEKQIPKFMKWIMPS